MSLNYSDSEFYMMLIYDVTFLSLIKSTFIDSIKSNTIQIDRVWLDSYENFSSYVTLLRSGYAALEDWQIVSRAADCIGALYIDSTV